MRTRSCGAAAIVVVLLAGACSSRDDSSPSLPTLPIPTEAPLPPRTVPPPTTTLAPTTTAVPPPVSVLVRYEAKSAAEQEVIEAMKVLLPLYERIVSNRDVDRELVGSVYNGDLVETIEGRVAESNAKRLVSVRGSIDRFVIESLRRDGLSDVVTVCYANNGKTIRHTDERDIVIDDSVVTQRIEYTPVRTPAGWRFDEVKELSNIDGEDQCAR